MSFHILSWMMGTGRGDDFISNTVLLTDTGAEVLTRTATSPIIR
jgi:Xaa-Pro dipeptidase